MRREVGFGKLAPIGQVLQAEVFCLLSLHVFDGALLVGWLLGVHRVQRTLLDYVIRALELGEVSQVILCWHILAPRQLRDDLAEHINFDRSPGLLIFRAPGVSGHHG